MNSPMDSGTVERFDQVVAELSLLMTERTGIRVNGVPLQRLHQAFAKRLEATDLGNPVQLLQQVRNSPQEWRELVSQVTIGESYFFRDKSLWQTLSRQLLPQLLSASQGRHVRIWSAGCANGEEVYSMASLCERLAPMFPNIAIEVLGSDIDHLALRMAERGEFSDYSLRGVSKIDQSLLFDRDLKHNRIRASLRRWVRFQEMNLVEWAGSGTSMGGVDLILCQNVLIYFSDAVLRQVVDALVGALNPGGLLLTGNSEVGFVPEGCSKESLGNRFGFRKVGAAMPLRRVSDLPKAPYYPTVSRQSASNPQVTAAWERVIAEDFSAARDLLVGQEDNMAWVAQVWIDYCEGRFDVALQQVERLLRRTPTSSEGLFVRGLLALQADDMQAAQADFASAHFYLAEVSVRLALPEAARLGWRNAARCSAVDRLRVQRFMGGFDATALAQLCLVHAERLQ